MKKVILEEYSEDWIYMQLHMFKRGLINGGDISDPLLSYVKQNGIVKLKFSNEKDYFNLFGFTSYDEELLTELYAMYQYFEHFSRWQGNHDWDEGYVLRSFDADNMNTIKEISSIIYPIKSFEDETEVSNLCKKLDELFQTEISSIIHAYCAGIEESIRGNLKKIVEEELCDIFQDEKIFNKVCFLTYYTTVDALLSLYDKFGKKNVSIYDLLKMVGQQKEVRGDYSELIYEYQFNSFDENEFNKEVKHYLEILMEKIEDSDIFLNIQEYGKIYGEVRKKFQFNKMYNIPKGEGHFTIKRIDPKTNKIEVAFAKSMNDKEKIGKYSLEDFNNFLYHPELNLNFDN